MPKKVVKKKTVKKSVSKDRPCIPEGEFDISSGQNDGNRIYVSVAKTINVGNYESLRVECGRGRTVQAGMSFDQVVKNTRVEVVKDLQEMITIVNETF